jgi:hypothetical protein
MSYECSSKEDAEAEAKRMTAAVADPTCRRFVAEICPVSGPSGRIAYGVRQEITFKDRPDLGWVNRGFVWQEEGIMRRRTR